MSKQDKILNLVKTWAVIPHPYDSKDAEGLLYLLSREEGVVIKVDVKLSKNIWENPDMREDAFRYEGYEEAQRDMIKAGYSATVPLTPRDTSE